MNKDTLKKWADALAGSEYVQIRDFLHTKDGFSITGVLTDLYRKEHGGEWQEAKSFCPQLAHLFVPHYEFVTKSSWVCQDGSKIGSGYMPCEEVAKWLDLKCLPSKCPREPNSPRNDPHIDHCPECEGNNFFFAILEEHMLFSEAAAKMRNLYGV